MSKDKLTDYSATNSLNTDIGGVNIDEGMLPSDVNNALREVMTHLKDFAEGTQAVNNIRFAGATTTGDINFGDNDKAVFGAGSDLQIYHEGTFSIIEDSGTGNLLIRANDLRMQDDVGAHFIHGNKGSDVKIYHPADGTVHFATTATGADITGTLTADGLTVDGSGTFVNFISSSNSAYVRLQNSVATGGYIGYQNDDLQLWANASYKGFMLDGATNDISFYDSTGTTQGFFWDASTQRLGINTTTPGARLQVGGNAKLGSASQTTFSGSLTTGGLDVMVGSGTSSGGAFQVWDDNELTTPRFTVTREGNVGIGTASPATNAEISSAINTTVRITSTNNFTSWSGNHFGALEFYTNDGSGAGAGIRSAIRSSATSSDGGYANLVFSNTVGAVNDVEVMRLDASGNLLVGKTNNALANDGVVIRGGGELLATNTSDLSGNFNRLSTDGGIVGFYKDGTTVGSIGSTSYADAFIAGTSTGIAFGGTNVTPTTNTGAISDNAKNLGGASARWNNLYLSGGVYLGGTGAANYLNDYEEGTWTPTYEAQVTAFTSVTYDPATYGKYVKVGDLVHIQGLIKTDAISGGSGAVLIGGLPFTSSSVTAVSVGYTNAFSGDYPSGGSLLGASTTVSLLYRTSANGALNNALDVTDLGTGGNDNYIEFSCTYRI